MLPEILVLAFLSGNAFYDLRTLTLHPYSAGAGTAVGILFCILTGRPALSAFSAILPGGILFLFVVVALVHAVGKALEQLAQLFA